MARIRSIKPEFWTSEQVMECSMTARLMFIGMWNFADDLGRLPYSAKSIKAQIFPSDDITVDSILGMVRELSANGLILIYTAEDKEFLQITGWQHQRIDKPQPGKCPPPLQDYSTNVPRPFPPDRIGKEGKGQDTKGQDTIDARDDLQRRIGNFRQAIVKAFEDANSPTVVETSRAELWLTQGYQEDICLAVISDIVKRKPSITTLSYFDKPISDAHASKAPARQAVPMTGEQPMNWDQILQTYKKIGHWSKWAGPDLTSPACRAPRELLEKYGLLADGRTVN